MMHVKKAKEKLIFRELGCCLTAGELEEHFLLDPKTNASGKVFRITKTSLQTPHCLSCPSLHFCWDRLSCHRVCLPSIHYDASGALLAGAHEQHTQVVQAYLRLASLHLASQEACELGSDGVKMLDYHWLHCRQYQSPPGTQLRK